MKVILTRTLLVLISILITVGCTLSPSAAARKAAADFVTAAGTGDRQLVLAMLAANADMTADQMMELYRGYNFKKAFDAQAVDPKISRGVEYIVLVSGEQSGYTRLSTLAVKRENDKWVVVRAGSSIAY